MVPQPPSDAGTVCEVVHADKPLNGHEKNARLKLASTSLFAVVFRDVL